MVRGSSRLNRSAAAAGLETAESRGHLPAIFPSLSPSLDPPSVHALPSSFAMRPAVQCPQSVRPLKRSLENMDSAPGRPSASKHPRLAPLPSPAPSVDNHPPSTSNAQASIQRHFSQRPSASQPLKIPTRIARRQRNSVGYSRPLPRSLRQYAGGYRKSLAQRSPRCAFSAPRPLRLSSSLLTVLARHQRDSELGNGVDSGLPRPLPLQTRD